MCVLKTTHFSFLFERCRHELIYVCEFISPLYNQDNMNGGIFFPSGGILSVLPEYNSLSTTISLSTSTTYCSVRADLPR